jgi:DNA-binding transcriptional LysR family regulator
MDDTGEKPCKIPSFRAAKDANLLRAEQALRCCDIIRGAVLDIATILTIHSLLSTCSIRETARLEGRAASTVSAALERMESALAIPLLRREGTVLSLTLEAQKRMKLFDEMTSLCRSLLAVAGDPAIRPTIRFSALIRFVAAAKTGSIRAAAKELDVGQPQLTRQLSELERNLDCALLLRTPGKNCPMLQPTAFAVSR